MGSAKKVLIIDGKYLWQLWQNCVKILDAQSVLLKYINTFPTFWTNFCSLSGPSWQYVIIGDVDRDVLVIIHTEIDSAGLFL